MADSEKTEQATPKKQEDERKKGNILQSRDVVNAMGLIIAVLMLQIFAPYILRMLQELYQDYLSHRLLDHYEMTVVGAGGYLRDFILKAAVCALPLMLVSLATAVVFTGAQTRFKLTFTLIKPKFEHISPLKGLKRLFSIRSLVELFKSIIKLTLILVIMYLRIAPMATQLPSLITSDLTQSLLAICKTVIDLLVTVSLTLIGISILDYFYQWWEHKRNLKMTKQEVRQEYKQMEGDPQVRARIRDLQRRMSMMRMMQKIPQASVIVTNPTHYAVALRYQPEEKGAPKVIAKGQDHLALRIIEEAKKYDIERVENVPLARGLYAAVEIDQEIPAEFYQTVAEVLAYVYKIKKAKAYRR